MPFTEFWAYVWEIVKRQGLVFVMLVAVSGYFYNENESIKADLKQCNEMYNSLQMQIINNYQYRYNTDYHY